MCPKLVKSQLVDWPGRRSDIRGGRVVKWSNEMTKPRTRLTAEGLGIAFEVGSVNHVR